MLDIELSNFERAYFCPIVSHSCRSFVASEVGSDSANHRSLPIVRYPPNLGTSGNSAFAIREFKAIGKKGLIPALERLGNACSIRFLVPPDLCETRMATVAVAAASKIIGTVLLMGIMLRRTSDGDHNYDLMDRQRALPGHQ